VLRDSIATFYAQAMSVRFNKSTSESTARALPPNPPRRINQPSLKMGKFIRLMLR
jgi:hypothetical protein